MIEIKLDTSRETKRLFGGTKLCPDEKFDGSLTSGISRGTLRTRMPCRTMDLGCSMDRTGAPSWTSVEVKLEDWDCLSLSLRVKVFFLIACLV